MEIGISAAYEQARFELELSHDFVHSLMQRYGLTVVYGFAFGGGGLHFRHDNPESIWDYGAPIYREGHLTGAARFAYITIIVIFEERNMLNMLISTSEKQALLAGLVSAVLSASMLAQTCTPPPGFADTRHPAIVPIEQLVSHTEEITIARPLAVVLEAIDKPLKDTFKKSDSLPTVSGEYPLTKSAFGTPGSRRLTCLTDGSSLEEEVLESDRDSSSYRFRYIVWKYTTEKARPIEYGIGDFHYVQSQGGSTHITWIYSFKLKEHNFPGNLGALGRWLFRKRFLETDYADLMRGVLDGYKTDAEQK